MRAYFSLAIDRSEAGKTIWMKKVIPGTVARSPKFREDMLGRIRSFAVATPFGIDGMPAFELPQERLEHFMVRITKGFLSYYYPDYDYLHATFSVRHVPSNEQSFHALEVGLIGTRYDERGDGVIRYRHCISDSGASGLWFYMFYDAVWILVHHAQPTTGA